MEELEIELINLYHQLIGQDNGIDGDHWSMPFITGAGENYADSEPKIMIVGKATNGWELELTNGEQFDQNDPVQLRNTSREESYKFLTSRGDVAITEETRFYDVKYINELQILFLESI